MKLHLRSTSLLLFILAGPANAATYMLGATFSADFPTAIEVYGTGVLAYEAETELPNGTYPWDSFSNLTVSFTVGAVTFTEDHLVTSTPSIFIEVRNGGFYFSNVGGPLVGSGAAVFVSDDQQLSFQPLTPGEDEAVRFFHRDGFPGGEGTVSTGGFYRPSVVPEPSAALLGAIGVFALLRRRRA